MKENPDGAKTGQCANFKNKISLHNKLLKVMSERISIVSSGSSQNLGESRKSPLSSPVKSRNLLNEVKWGKISYFTNTKPQVKTSRLMKKLSLDIEPFSELRGSQKEIVDKFENEDLYREKLKILLNKNDLYQ